MVYLELLYTQRGKIAACGDISLHFEIFGNNNVPEETPSGAFKPRSVSSASKPLYTVAANSGLAIPALSYHAGSGYCGSKATSGEHTWSSSAVCARAAKGANTGATF